MKIINRKNYFENKQLNKIVSLMEADYIPEQLIICETIGEMQKLYKYMNLSHYLMLVTDRTIWMGKVEGIYLKKIDTAIVFVFSENDDGEDKHSKQLYSIHALAHELRHRWQEKNKYKGNYEKDADKFASKFVNGKSKKIARIMNWKDQWEVEEYD